jgi:hypothetical protein
MTAAERFWVFGGGRFLLPHNTHITRDLFRSLPALNFFIRHFQAVDIRERVLISMVSETLQPVFVVTLRL